MTQSGEEFRAYQVIVNLKEFARSNVDQAVYPINNVMNQLI
jgi:hypothetical protein